MEKKKEPEPLDEQEVIRRIRQGERELFEVLIRRHNPFLYKAGRAYGFGHEDVQDLMQESFVSAYVHLAGFREHAAFRTWIMRIMLNNCHKKAQRQALHHQLIRESGIPEKSIPMFSQPQGSAEKEMVRRELGAIIENTLLTVPLDLRIVFSLREINGMSTAETAEALSISEANVKVRLNRARKLLRSGIEKHYTAEELFDFNLVYCNAIVQRVFEELELTGS